MKKILLLNLPSKSFNYSRDYFCSKVLKADYVEQPLDLLILSGILFNSFKLDILDATMLNLDFKRCFYKIKSLSPDIIIFLSGSVSQNEDFGFIKQIKKENKYLKLIGIGDIFWRKEIFVENSWIDAVLLDFTTEDILNYLNGEYEKVRNMMFRNNNNIIFTDTIESHKKEFEIPIPRHELFLNKRYTLPFVKHLPFTTILTAYGCPFSCPFCIYSLLGYKIRKLENVFEELNYINFLRIPELFIKDQTFGCDKERTFELCMEIIKRKWKFSWTAFSRADVLDYELLSIMKEAGCHTLILGVETANKELLKKYKNGLTHEKIEYTFKLCKKLNIRTVGTFILGFPYESKESILETIDFAIKLRCDFASFNIFVPKPGTSTEKEFCENNEGNKFNNKKWDQSGIISVSGNGIISAKDIAALLTFAIRRFYFTPHYIIVRLLRMRSIDELKMLIRNGIGLIRNFIKISQHEN
jgi:radical SAM superfamily enzyme YgiQ (UPF0313 family)